MDTNNGKFKLTAFSLMIFACSWSALAGRAAHPYSDSQPERVSHTRRLLRNQFVTTSDSQKNIKVEDAEWHDAMRNRDIPVKLYLPQGKDGRRPIMIFSHGLGGSREAAAYLGQYLAEKGYICVHVQHPGSDTPIAREAILAGRENAFKKLGAAANGQNLMLRIDDVKFVIDELERRNKSGGELKGKLDLDKIAVAGHSFGAGTAIALCGQSFGFRSAADPRIKAGVYLSAPVNLHGRDPKQVYGQIKVPGLLMTGTEDSSPIGKTDAKDRRIPFDGMTAPHQYLVNYIGGDHAIFGGTSFRPGRAADKEFHQSINKVVGAFLDAYLCGDKSAQQWLDGSGAKNYLGDSAVFERK